MMRSSSLLSSSFRVGLPLLAIRYASKAYATIPALIAAALDLHAGECHALMGENGAGKSTLIKILAGVTAPDRFEATLRGQPIQVRSAAESFAHGFRFIHQELNVVPQLSVAENIFLSQRYPRRAGVLVDWRRLNADALQVLAGLAIHHLDPREKMARLSVGDQMLVKIASTFLGGAESNAAIYVMDEPTAALTGAEAVRLFGVISELKARGCAVLYVSHRLEEIFRIADRVTVMRDGRVIATKQVAATDERDLIQMMTGREFNQVFPPRSAPLGDEIRLTARELRTAHIQAVNFDLRAGEILGVAGLVGAGRTELLRAIIGADRLKGGALALDGVTLRQLSVAQAWQRQIAFVPEERRTQGLMLSRSIRDNVALPHLGRLYGGIFSNARAEEKIAVKVGAAVRLKAQHPRQIARQLSGGNQQKILFARAMVHSPRLLLLDEPTRGVDIGAKIDLYGLIRELSTAGTSVIMASSELGELLGLCDRILIMRERRQAALVATAGLTQDQLLALCYGT